MDNSSVPPKLKKSEMVAARLRDYIVHKKLRPGDRLPTEGELAELFGVSRISVREATKALGFLGIIEAAPRRGLSVGQFSMEQVSKYLSFQLAVMNLSVEDLVATRIIIETGVLDHTARRMAEDVEIYDQLNRLNERLRQVATLEDWIENDRQFHYQLVAASGLQAVMAFNDLLQIFFLQLQDDFPRWEWAGGIRAHQSIIDSLRDNDVSTADRLLRAHIDSHRLRLHHAGELSP